MNNDILQNIFCECSDCSFIISIKIREATSSQSLCVSPGIFNDEVFILSKLNCRVTISVCSIVQNDIDDNEGQIIQSGIDICLLLSSQSRQSIYNSLILFINSVERPCSFNQLFLDMFWLRRRYIESCSLIGVVVTTKSQVSENCIRNFSQVSLTLTSFTRDSQVRECSSKFSKDAIDR